jgi:hypothetical protein
MSRLSDNPRKVSAQRADLLESFVASGDWERLVRINGPNRCSGSVLGASGLVPRIDIVGRPCGSEAASVSIVYQHIQSIQATTRSRDRKRSLLRLSLHPSQIPAEESKTAGHTYNHERITRQQWRRRSTHIRQRSARPFRLPQRDHRRTRHRQAKLWSRLQRCVAPPHWRCFCAKRAEMKDKGLQDGIY